jgi:drug/metabolite transporter (DMT)-like permease
MTGILFIVAACLLWAIDTLIRYPLLYGGISAETIVFFEHFFLLLIFTPILLSFFRKLMSTSVRNVFYLLLLGAFGSALGTLAFTKAFGMINPSLVILLQKFQPVVAIIGARFIVGERFHKKFFLWAAVCLIGGVLITYQDFVPGLMKLDFSPKLFDSNALYGYGLTFVAVFSWGLATVFGKRLSLDGFSEKEIMSGRYFFGFCALIPLFIAGKVSVSLDMIVWGKILAMVLITGVLSMYLYYKGLIKIPAKVCTLAEMSFPLMAIVVNWLFLGKELHLIQIIGGIVLLLGSTVIQFRRY